MSCLNCLKRYINLSTLLSFAVGIAATILSLSIHNWNPDLFLFEAKSIRDNTLYTLLIFGIFLIFISIFGIIAAFKKNHRCLGIY
jgi:hypothetical protein